MEAASSYTNQTGYEQPILYDYFYFGRFCRADCTRCDPASFRPLCPQFISEQICFGFAVLVSSTAIFVLFGISKFFFNNPLVLLIFIFLFFSSIYLSVIRLANMRNKDWLILIGIFGTIGLFFFFPKF